MSLAQALIIAGLAIGAGIGVGMVGMFYFLYRIFGVLAAAMTGDPNVLRRAILGKPKPPKPPEDMKVVPEMPDTGIEMMQENSEVMEKLRKKQDRTDESSTDY